MTNNLPDFDSEYSDSENEILAIYGGAENMKNLVPLTEQQVIDIKRAKVLSYLEWSDNPEWRRQMYLDELKELDAYLIKLNSERGL